MKTVLHIALLLLASQTFAAPADDVLSVDGIQILPEATPRPPIPKPPMRKIKKKVPSPPPAAPPAATPTPAPAAPAFSLPVETKPTPPPPVVEPRKPDSISLKESVPAKQPMKVKVALGGTLGMNYAFPAVSVEFAVARKTSVALMGIWYNNFSKTEKQTALGGLLFGEYFFTGENYKGIAARAGLGFYSLTAETDTGLQSTVPLAVMGTVNYHLMTQSGVSLGIGVGLQYALAKRIPEIAFNGVLPLFTFDVGMSFK